RRCHYAARDTPLADPIVGVGPHQAGAHACAQAWQYPAVSDHEDAIARWTIEPEPTAAELVAILTAMQSADEPAVAADAPGESPWALSARREQLRTDLDTTGNGWHR